MSNLQYPTVEHVQANTKLDDPEVIEAFIETLKWLDERAPSKFDGLPGKYSFNINTVMCQTRDENYKTCGTVCCIAGAAMLYQAKGDFELADSMCIHDYIDKDPVLDFLFFPVSGRNHNAFNAARALRHYLFTGRVSWNVKAGTTYDV